MAECLLGHASWHPHDIAKESTKAANNCKNEYQTDNLLAQSRDREEIANRA